MDFLLLVGVMVAGFVLVLAFVALAMKRVRDKARKLHECGPKAMYDRLSFYQLMLQLEMGKTETIGRASIDSVFNGSLDPTIVSGLRGCSNVAHVPCDVSRVSMFEGRQFVICLSQDKRTIVHQELLSDDRYLVHFIRATSNRNLEYSFEVLSTLAKFISSRRQPSSLAPVALDGSK